MIEHSALELGPRRDVSGETELLGMLVYLLCEADCELQYLLLPGSSFMLDEFS